DKIPQIYANADVIVFPSMWPEPFGRIAIEAMAAGKPIIGSAIGGINETIADGCGITVEPGNVDQLRDALRILQHDPELRNIMGKKGKIAVTQYKEETVIETLIAYYQTLPPVIK
ncbi:TPA: glycosyltransferase family 4 protein, partial [Candidatus Woesearchaeota archaeon]|nr:glycosyltransferase family 4 protein [Candidatus Woesearchaeota archaeon]